MPRYMPSVRCAFTNKTSSIFPTYIPHSKKQTGTSQSSYCYLKVRKLKELWAPTQILEIWSCPLSLELLRLGIGCRMRGMSWTPPFTALWSRLAGVRPINWRYEQYRQRFIWTISGSPCSIHLSPFKTPFLSIYMSMCYDSNKNKDNIAVSWQPPWGGSKVVKKIDEGFSVRRDESGIELRRTSIISWSP